MTFATVGDANFYGLLGTTLAFANNDVNPVDVAALELGVGAEVFLGDQHTVGVFGEYAGTMYFAPTIMFSFMSGFRIGLRYYFDVADSPVDTAATSENANPKPAENQKATLNSPALELQPASPPPPAEQAPETKQNDAQPVSP